MGERRVCGSREKALQGGEKRNVPSVCFVKRVIGEILGGGKLVLGEE